MCITCDQVNGSATACVKMSGIWYVVGINCNQYTFGICFSFKNALAVCQYDRAEIAII